MSALFSDTRPEAEAVLIRLLREAPFWRKLEMVAQMNEAVKTMMFTGLREIPPRLIGAPAQADGRFAPWP
jgi:hypothetical protein